MEASDVVPELPSGVTYRVNPDGVVITYRWNDGPVWVSTILGTVYSAFFIAAVAASLLTIRRFTIDPSFASESNWMVNLILAAVWLGILVLMYVMITGILNRTHLELNTREVISQSGPLPCKGFRRRFPRSTVERVGWEGTQRNEDGRFDFYRVFVMRTKRAGDFPKMVVVAPAIPSRATADFINAEIRTYIEAAPEGGVGGVFGPADQRFKD